MSIPPFLLFRRVLGITVHIVYRMNIKGTLLQKPLFLLGQAHEIFLCRVVLGKKLIQVIRRLVVHYDDHSFLEKSYSFCHRQNNGGIFAVKAQNCI